MMIINIEFHWLWNVVILRISSLIFPRPSIYEFMIFVLFLHWERVFFSSFRQTQSSIDKTTMIYRKKKIQRFDFHFKTEIKNYMANINDLVQLQHFFIQFVINWYAEHFSTFTLYLERWILKAKKHFWCRTNTFHISIYS